MLYYAQGDALITAEELFEPTVSREISTFHQQLADNHEPHAVQLSTGALTAENALRSFDPGAGAAPIGFNPIGLGLPLTVMIRQVYTGKFPKGGIFGGGKDLLLTSAVKSLTTFDAKPRAINFLVDKVAAKSRLDRPPASKQGTPFTFYSPALLERSLTLDLTLVFDTFPKEVFDQVGDVFQAASGIPIFQTHSLFLLAAGMLTRLIGSAGEAIFDGKPAFTSSDGIDIALPGSAPIAPGFALITSENVDQMDPNFRARHHVNDAGKVVAANGEEYQGDIPHIVISLDGTPQEELASFAPTAASAAILSRFFGIKEGQQQPLNILIDAIKLFNDITYRHQVDRLDEQLKALPAGDPKRTALEEKRAALLANILEDLLKPKG